MVRSIVSVIVLMAAVAVLGSEVPSQEPEVPNPLVEKVLPVIAKGIQGLAPNDPNFPCKFCTEIMQMFWNMTTDKTLLAFIEKFMETYACDYLVPSAYKEYCLDYVHDIPELIIAFADTFLNPTKDCAAMCGAPPANRHPNNVLNVFTAKKMKKYGGL